MAREGYLVALSKSQIDRIGDSLRAGKVDADIVGRLEQYRREFDEAYWFVEKTLAEDLRLSVTGRPSKSTIAITEKLKRETIRLSQIQDIAGCRVIVGNIVDQNVICSRAEVLLGRVEVEDRRAKPSNGYRAVHLLAEHKGYTVEVQVRTRPQHAWAEISEKFADAYGQEIKYGRGDEEALQFLSSLSGLTDELERIDLEKWRLSRSTAALRAGKRQGGFEARTRMKQLSRDRTNCVRRIRDLFAPLGK